MPDTPGQRDVIRERLLALLAVRVTTWDPEGKSLIGALVFDLISGKADAVGGLTLGADPIAGAPIRVAIVDDTVTTGASTLDDVDGCRKGGLDRVRSRVRGVPCTAIFTCAALDDRVKRGRNAAPPT